MNKGAAKTARLGLFIEPDLRSAIEREAARRETKMSRVVRAMLRDQLVTDAGECLSTSCIGRIHAAVRPLGKIRAVKR